MIFSIVATLHGCIPMERNGGWLLGPQNVLADTMKIKSLNPSGSSTGICQCHGCRCPGPLGHRIISNHNIDFLSLMCSCVRWGRVSNTRALPTLRNYGIFYVSLRTFSRQKLSYCVHAILAKFCSCTGRETKGNDHCCHWIARRECNKTIVCQTQEGRQCNGSLVYLS